MTKYYGKKKKDEIEYDEFKAWETTKLPKDPYHRLVAEQNETPICAWGGESWYSKYVKEGVVKPNTNSCEICHRTLTKLVDSWYCNNCQIESLCTEEEE
jgi:hypothetical protein